MQYVSWRKEWFYILLAFLLPLIFFHTVFTTRSFGFDCAPSVMGNNPPWGQQWIDSNGLCGNIPDAGAYVWQHPAHWSEAMRQYMNGSVPIWSQNIALGLPLAANFQSTVYFLPILPFLYMFDVSGYNLLYIDLFFLFRYMVMAGGMYLFIRSLGQSKLLGYIAGLAYFSSGYFQKLPNIAHHNVDMLLPLLAYATTVFFVTKQVRWLGISALISGISLFGGMPESSIFVLFFSAVYAFFLGIIYLPLTGLSEEKEKLSFNKWKHAINWKLTVGGLSIPFIGLLLSAILYIPGLEFIAHGGSLHHPGVPTQKSIPFTNVLSFIYPEILLTPSFQEAINRSNMLPFQVSSWNYVGYTIFYLYLLAVMYMVIAYKKIRSNGLLLMLFFFTLLSLSLVLQNYGIVRNYIYEQFPVFDATIFTKYAAALINLTVITTASLFISAIVKEQKETRAAVSIGGAIIFIFLSVLATVALKDVLMPYKEHLKIWYFPNNVTYGMLTAALLAALITLVNKRIVLSIAILGILLFEFYNYLPKGGYMGRYDTLRAPPAVEKLQQMNDGTFRIHGANNILYPNLATVYDLIDFRMLDALWIKRHYAFVEHFYQAPNVFRIISVKEDNAVEPAKILDNPFFDLTSVRYLLTYNPLDSLLLEKSKLIKEIADLNSPRTNAELKHFRLNEDERPVLFTHAPSTVRFMIDKPAGAEYFVLFPAMGPDIPEETTGDGVLFTANAYADSILLAQNQVIATAPASTEWQQMQLGPFQKDIEQRLTIELITDPLATEFYDWSGWGGFYWDSEMNSYNEKFELVYNNEMKMYENKQYLPRLRFVNKTICTQPLQGDAVEPIIELMEQNTSEIRTTAIIEKEGCSVTEYATAAAQIKDQTFTDMAITFAYSAPTPQYVVLSDAFYPGWNVYVNGEKGTIDAANLAMRGISLPAGDNVQVEIKYEPMSFYAGAIITAITSLLVLIMIGMKRKVD